MQFGLFGGAVARVASSVDGGGATLHRASTQPSEDSDSLHGLIRTIVDAESLGYRSAFLVEHHFTGSDQISASLNLLGFLAARTSRIRLGTAVIVVPWHNPVLLAEQVATVDVLSGGRLDLGVGKGYRPNEFERFCIPMEEASERFEESMALLRRCLTSDERFSHHSERWQFADIVVEPAPVQRPHPPFWLAAGRPESIRGAAAEGYHLLLDQFATYDVAIERFRLYRDTVMEAGRDFDPASVAVARSVAIVDDEAGRARAVQARMETLTKMNRLAAGADGRNVSSMMSDPDTRQAALNGTLIGTPEEIVERLSRLADAGVRYVLLAGLMNNPRELQRFAEQVMPHFAVAKGAGQHASEPVSAA